ncbi:hypothetical protein Tsubulata_019453 [Turnera subulata]|uniref:Mechanosensitive ion channel protein n=1 Tax=Turnera subulata TaxID=218843 RepID=A0A9Q0GM62_9ROSI|nr:hypothetical protein Tsubulata_019453 [Turnera subulata]
MDFSLKRSFKSHGSYKHTKKLSIGGAGGGGGSGGDRGSHEELPILARQVSDDSGELHERSQVATIPLSDRPEVIVKVDGSRSDSSSSSDSDGNKNSNAQLGNQDKPDPPSILISQFLNQQKHRGGEISLDMDMEMDEFKNAERNLPPFPESPLAREMRVSFEPSVSGGLDLGSESMRRRYRDETQQDKDDEILKCSSNKSFVRQNTPLTTSKTKSRLLDPEPDELQRMPSKIPKSGPLRSGLIGKAAAEEEEEDDPLADEDLPDEFLTSKLSVLTLLQWVGLIGIVAILMCTLAFRSLKEKNILHLQLWKWEVLLLVLISGRLVSGWGIRIIVFLIERNFLLRKRVLYFVYGLKKGVQNCWWLGLVLLAWHLLFDKKVRDTPGHDVLKYVTKVLVCFLVANFIWLIKTLMVKVLASSFHVSTYFDRIQESVFNQYVIETLSGPPVIEVQRAEEEMERTIAEIRRLQNAGATIPPDLRAAVFPNARSSKFANTVGQRSFISRSFKVSGQLSKKGSKKGDDGIKIDHLHKLNNKNVSAWNMKRLMKIVRYGSLSTLDEQIRGSSVYDDSTREIRSEYEAKAAARKIFNNVARNGSKYIYLEDLMRFMEGDQALKTMELIEGSSLETSRISKSSLKNWVVQAFRERKALSLTLNDTKTAVNKLHRIVDVIVAILVLVICLVILGVATSKFFVLLGSQIVVVSFIFGNTAKILFESVIFLFVIHPFDVGDRCEVDGVQLIVEEMNILTTLFLRTDNQKVIFPNATLASKPIGNFYRSPDMFDTIEFYVHVATPVEKIAALQQRIISFIEAKKEHWYPAPTVIVRDMVLDLESVKIAIWPRHRINHQDTILRYERRSLLLEEMVKIFQELDVQYRLYPRDVNILTKPPSKPYYPA